MPVKIPQPDESPLEAAYRLQLMELRQREPWIAVPQRNFVFMPPRKFELDFSWPDLWFGVEIDGAAHRNKSRFHSDHEKHALAMLAGWKILAVTRVQIFDGKAIAWTEEVLRRLTSRDQAPWIMRPLTKAEAHG